MISRFTTILVLFVLWPSCATNPVTGRSELQLYNESQEIAMGVEHYPLEQQVAGGEYTLDPDLSDYVRAVGRKVSAVADRPQLPYEFVIVNEGSWNAWALPGGKIALHRGLLEAMRNESELAAVIAHEIVHAAARHSAQQMERGVWMQMGVVTVASLAGEENQQLAESAGTLVAGLGMLRYSRSAESEADYYGIQYMVRAGYDPKGAVTLQELFAENMDSSGGWLASHPASIERVRKNQEAIAHHSGGYIGEAEYRTRTRLLRERAPAYDLYEKGLEALEKKNPQEALRLSLEARKRVPKEAQFFGLSARAYQAMGNNKAAMEAWNQAIQRNPDWYYYWLERGLLQETFGNKTEARRDLKESYERLPTQSAEDALKRLGA